MSRIVVFTTPTSGTGSLWRITKTFLPEGMESIQFIDHCLNGGMAMNEIKKAVLPKHGCFLFNQPHLFNFDQDFSDTKFILNFRDPRDMSCNQYFWVFSHPSNKPEPELSIWRDGVRKAGIDNFVLGQDHRFFFANHVLFSQRADLLKNTLACSYVQLCFDTIGVVDRVAQFVGNTDQDLIQRTRLSEHPSALAGANRWVGQKWEGADLFPGRARVELKPDTYATLTSRYAAALGALKSFDDPRFGYFYGA